MSGKFSLFDVAMIRGVDCVSCSRNIEAPCGVSPLNMASISSTTRVPSISLNASAKLSPPGSLDLVKLSHAHTCFTGWWAAPPSLFESKSKYFRNNVVLPAPGSPRINTCGRFGSSRAAITFSNPEYDLQLSTSNITFECILLGVHNCLTRQFADAQRSRQGTSSTLNVAVCYHETSTSTRNVNRNGYLGKVITSPDQLAMMLYRGLQGRWLV
mmetsp:Transcript_10183/g.16659  ORF Transcript_10183/g.16659 Transcript_10183/m.16659 type:complete len:213 (-) Transcript_10183:112-750(-)